ncbi:MAG: C40 family peptidase [Bacteroidales bacterium]|nr:C40 family peptidase [Bacteroidales bacterium]
MPAHLSGYQENLTFIHQKTHDAMHYGICLLSVAALRQKPDHKSEMVSQLLFGECFRVLEQHREWCMIEHLYDGYKGWLAKNQAFFFDEARYNKLMNSKRLITTTLLAQITETGTDSTFTLSAGSDLYADHEGCMNLDGKKYRYSGGTTNTQDPDRDEMMIHARKFLHTPYLWGGRSAFGLDCSGFVQQVFKLSGKILPRDASMQAQEGEPVHLINESVPGDLVFFDNEEGLITHVGLIIEPGMVIHAHGKVRIDRIDHQGIFDAENKQYTHHLRLIKRM